MRQLCLSADLVPQSFLDDIRNPPPPPDSPAVPIKNLSPEEREALIAKLKQSIADQEECSVCFDVLNDPRITDCGHPCKLDPLTQLTPVCLACITEVIKRQALCPMDRHPLSPASLLELPPDADTFDESEHAAAPPTRSAKIAELVRYLRAFDGGDKALVFSQFTTFLDRVAAVLEEEGIAFCRFDGSMPAKKVQYAP